MWQRKLCVEVPAGGGTTAQTTPPECSLIYPKVRQGSAYRDRPRSTPPRLRSAGRKALRPQQHGPKHGRHGSQAQRKSRDHGEG